MKFSLRVMLIGLCLLGAFVGMMGNWLIRSPEKFFAAIQFCSTVLPFVLATGTIIWIGLKRVRRPGLVAWGVCLLLTPVVIQVTASMFWPLRDPLRVLSNQRLIVMRLPQRVEEPWVWNELERRLAAGNLSQPEVDSALSQLVAHMTTTRPQGWHSSLPWQSDFIKAAIAAKMISEATFFALCDAFFGPQPVVRPVLRIFEDENRFALNFEFGNPFSDYSGLGVELLYQVTGATVNGAPVQVKGNNSRRNWSGVVTTDLQPGEHEITLEIECAYVDGKSFTAMSPQSIPIEQWPKALKRWKLKVPVPVKVEPRPE